MKEDFLFERVGRMDAINSFVSEEALFLHREYLNTLKLKYSVIEKSIPQIQNMSVRDIVKKRNLRYKDEIIALRSDILCHELFFDSFSDKYQSSEAVRKAYRTEASFIYELLEMGKEGNLKFLVVCIEGGVVGVRGLCEASQIMKIANPMLCIDLCEHSYFLDYGFSKEKYLLNLLPHLKLSVLDDFLNNRH